MDGKKSGGLQGIIAGESAICTVGEEVGLNYRGYSIRDLTEYASFEEVAYLLIYGKLPNQKELTAYRKKLVKLRELPKNIKTALELIPKNADSMDVLRTGCSLLGTLEQESAKNNQYQIADRLLAIFPSMLLYWYHFTQSRKRIRTQSSETTIAGYFLHLLHGKKPDALQRRVLDISLMLYAEHEFNASTFAARVTISTGSDFYSAICSAIGTLRGPLHGGANERAIELITQFKTPALADVGVRKMLAEKKLIMGFGHRVYKTSDPRSNIIKAWAQKLAVGTKNKSIMPVAEVIEKLMWEEKQLFPNLDFYSATAYYFCDIPTRFFTPLFVFSRTSGWAAHIMEQRANNRLIRPLSNYIGPAPQTYLNIEQRK